MISNMPIKRHLKFLSEEKNKFILQFPEIQGMDKELWDAMRTVCQYHVSIYEQENKK